MTAPSKPRWTEEEIDAIYFKLGWLAIIGGIVVLVIDWLILH